MKTQKQIKGKISRMRVTLKILRDEIKKNNFRNVTPADKAFNRAEREVAQEIELLRWVLK